MRASFLGRFFTAAKGNQVGILFHHENELISLLLELDEQWSTGHRYLEMQTYWQWRGKASIQSECPPAALAEVRP